MTTNTASAAGRVQALIERMFNIYPVTQEALEIIAACDVDTEIERAQDMAIEAVSALEMIASFDAGRAGEVAREWLVERNVWSGE